MMIASKLQYISFQIIDIRVCHKCFKYQINQTSLVCDICDVSDITVSVAIDEQACKHYHSNICMSIQIESSEKL